MALNLRTSLQLLAYLDVLITEKQVTRAAEKMGIGQPAMSGALTRLRELFNDPILVKTSLGMEPTARAVELNKRVNEALRLIEEAVSPEGSFDPAAASMTFKVMASEGVAQLFLPAIMKTVREQAPEVRFGVAAGDIRHMHDVLRDGEYDLVLGYVRHPPLNLYRLLVYPQRLVCIAASDNPKIGSKFLLDDFVALPHVVWGMSPVPFPTIEVLVDEILAQRDLSRNVVLRVPNVSMSATVVAATDMIAVVPERVAMEAAESDGLRILPLPFPVDSIDISMYWHERCHRDPAHIWLRNVIRRAGEALRSQTNTSSMR
ncbi:LysR family transcriptional regulator [Pollutimonas sp. M17]|uniref:LysR family transcriptional regulator n=1 Tax=Pollutimonas sp. M17 TaxID=2962065 RepID=UPI0021F3E60E|nr:LysR family transcriptional regulator [Pollutimonas sp. M17]UYO94823.1 LysR family transcriptional regulator [Pollutimonas sp. M17]